MSMKKITAVLSMAAIMMSLTAAPAMAKNGPDKNNWGHEKKVKAKMCEKFKDLGGYEWCLTDITKIVGKGIFGGLGKSVFAPGAKITQQEVTVAALRLMGKEAIVGTLTKDEINNLLKNIPDQAKIAAWARAAIAQMVKLGIVSPDKEFNPTDSATRLDVAVLLVKALGYEQEAQAAMGKTLSFRDADKIPAALRGYVYVATELNLIAGYNENGYGAKTFRPDQAVKRVEAAIMMARADNLVDRRQADEVRGTVKSVNTQTETVIVTKSAGQDVALTLADDAVILVENQEKTLNDVSAGMTVMIKLDSAGKIKYIEAKTVLAKTTTVTGTISVIMPQTNLSLALITVNGTMIPVADKVTVTVNNAAAAFSALKVGDTVTLTVKSGLVTKIAAGSQAETTVSGTITALTFATADAAGVITINGTAYTVPASAVLKINNTAAVLADLKIGDVIVLTLVSGQVTKAEVTRTVVHGNLTAIQAPTASSLGSLTLGTAVYPIASGSVFTVNGVSASIADLRIGDSIALTLLNGQAVKAAVTR